MTTIDWPSTITAAKDIVLGASAAVTATVAVLGLKGWRRELKGKADFEVARALARATYKLRDELTLCRSPFVRGEEFPAGYNSLSVKSAKEEADAWAHVYRSRWEPVRLALQEFDGQALEAESLWGVAVPEKTQAFRSCAVELLVAIQAFVDDKAHNGDDFKSNPDFGKQIRSKVFSLGEGKDNSLSSQVLDSVKGIETLLRPYLARR
jgi:hypothetical protein